jgi:hypothetical protein
MMIEKAYRSNPARSVSAPDAADRAQLRTGGYGMFVQSFNLADRVAKSESENIQSKLFRTCRRADSLRDE